MTGAPRDMPELSDFSSSAHSGVELIRRLENQIHEALSPLVAGAASYALFDFPDHNNVGDSAILLGELAYLERRHGAIPAYMCRADKCDYGRLAGRYEESLILVHGGGNFGDIWSWHHDRREALLKRFPGRRIIQLPQTIQFGSKASLARTGEIIKRHGNFALLVRDTRSYELAKAEFDCTVILCPDLAFCMGPLRRIDAPIRDLLCILRDDQERAATLGEAVRLAGRDASVADWRMDNKPVRAVRKLVALAESIARTPANLRDLDTLRNGYLTHLAQKRVERGLRLLSSGRFIITDRLHAYILAILLDVPRAVVDNNYGKLSGFIETWMRGDDLVPTSKTLDQAIAAWESEPNDRRRVPVPVEG